MRRTYTGGDPNIFAIFVYMTLAVSKPNWRETTGKIPGLIELRFTANFPDLSMEPKRFAKPTRAIPLRILKPAH